LTDNMVRGSSCSRVSRLRQRDFRLFGLINDAPAE
jgi:hypothetical protein